MTKRTALAGGVVGGLAVVEFTSGVIQGYYTPLFSDIARKLAIHDADINWLEAVQLLLSAIVVPLLARLGDMYGHRRVLLGTLILTGASAWGVAVAPSFPLFLTLWALMGFYVVWLPLNVAIIYARARRLPDTAALTRRASGVIVVALQAGAISGALAAGQLGVVFKTTSGSSSPYRPHSSPSPSSSCGASSPTPASARAAASTPAAPWSYRSACSRSPEASASYASPASPRS